MWNQLLKEQSGAGFSYPEQTHISSGGDITIAGMFSVPVDFDPDANSTNILSLKPGSSQNVFFGRYGDEGELKWIKQLEGDDWMSIGGMDLDGNGNIYLTGPFDDVIDLNPSSAQALFTPPNPSSEDFFISKYTPLGAFVWARQISSTTHVWSEDLVIDNSGNIIVAGRTRGATDFDPGTGTSTINTPNDYVFIAKYNSSGSYTNAIAMGVSGSQQELNDLEVDGSGNIYITGKFRGTVDFDPGPSTKNLTARGSDDFFMAKYNPNLQMQWAHQIGSGSGEGDRMILDIQGAQIIVSGSYRDTIDVDLQTGSTQLFSNGSFDIFFAQYDLSANLQSSASIGGSGEDFTQSMKIYNSDSIYFAGQFQGTVDFNPGAGTKNLTAGSSQSLFFAAYDNNFGYNWASKISGSGDVWSASINNMGNNPVLFGRVVSGTANFNDAWPTSPANYTGPASFIAKYEKCGDLIITPSTNDADCGEKNGNASITVQGGTAPYTYQWTSGDTTDIADSLWSGTYYATVTDVKACSSVSDPIIINDTDGPIISVQTKVNVSCNGGGDGVIVITVAGGITPYSYKWSNGSINKNINALSAGIYELTVTDDDNCKSTDRIEITQPNPILVTPIASEPSCGVANGTLTAVASGGASPYSYNWTPGGSGGTQFNIAAGVYRVTVTDGNSCIYTQAIALSDDNAPDISLDNVVDASCGTGGGAINITVSGGIPGYLYAWTPGGYTTQDISGLQPGEYDLIVTDQATCKAAFVQEVKAVKPTAPEICIVDVDADNGNAQVVWEKPSSRGIIDSYNIYRETTTKDVFDLVEDSIDFGALSLFEDTHADTWTRPWSYKLSFTDTCGIISEQSTPHTTIHTVVTKNPQGDFNILWTRYKGNFPVNSYTCWRYTDSNSTAQADSIATWTSNIHSYTDTKSPSSGSDVYYYMSVPHPNGCTPTEATTRKSARSNRGSLGPPNFGDTLGIDESIVSLAEYNVYPNPSNGAFTVNIETAISGIMQFQLKNVNGNTVYSEQKFVMAGSNSVNFDVKNVSMGFYLLQLDLNNERSFAKVIITSRE